MTIQGVESSRGDGYVVLYVREFSDALKILIRSELATICHGTTNADSGLELFLYGSTVREFWKRYREKSPETKLGIIGELLAHILVCKYLDGYESASLLFNPIERSIKKGFDLNFIKENHLWYGEVKAGEGDEVVDQKNKKLLNRAKRGLIEYFENADALASKWYAACNEVSIIFADNKAHQIKEMLNKDYFENRLGNSPSTANVVLISVPFHKVTNGLVDIEQVNLYRQDLISEGTFGNCLVISIQKSTITAVEEFIENEAREYERTTI